MFKKLIIFLFFTALCLASHSQSISFSANTGKSPKIKGKFFVTDWKILYDSPGYPDSSSKWEDIDSMPLRLDDARWNRFKGDCWFRRMIKNDTLLKSFKAKSVRVNLAGAADFYLDGRLIHSAGKTSKNNVDEQRIVTDELIIPLDLPERDSFEIMIHFSNHALLLAENRSPDNAIGLMFFIGETDTLYRQLMNAALTTTGFSLSMIVFFLTLSILHLIIFLFNRDEKSNVFYSAFCLLISIIFLCILINHRDDQGDLAGQIAIVCTDLIIGILPFMLRSFFKLPINKWVFLTLGLTLFSMITTFSEIEIGFYFYPVYILYSSLICFISIRTAILLKFPGVRIISSGFIIFLSFILLILAAVIFQFQVNEVAGQAAFFLFIFFFAAVSSIPLSITIFLANQISRTKLELTHSLSEVKELSARNLEQEKEKQAILSQQNIMLEEQVKQRTAEISNQKKIIEEKNKDIIDSINYAKRIQTAMLPDEADFFRIFSNAFVIYQPKDIVSGDFYYATEYHDTKIIIGADCTGHGVPGALMSMVGSNIINKLIHENGITSPKQLIESLHHELRQALKQDQEGSENRDGMDLSVVMLENGKLHYSGANRPLLYLNNSNELHEIKPSKTPVGGSHNTSIEITEYVISTEHIAEIFLFSDGFADQFGGGEGKKLMTSRFKKWLMEISSLDVTEQKTVLLRNFTHWKQESEQVDDVMVIGIKLI